MLLEYTNPRHRDKIDNMSIEPKYSLDTPAIEDPNEYDKTNYYLGNANLKREGINFMWSPEMREEFKRCKEDILYFAQRYCYIRTLDDDDKILIKLRHYQKEMLRALEISGIKHYMLLAARQSAKSTTYVIRILHSILFNKNYEIAIVAQVGATAREIFSRVQAAYEMLPFWMQQGVKEYNKGSIELENGSKAFARASGKNSLRGLSLNEVLLDEACFIENFEEFYRSTLPTISSGKKTKITLASTPNGKKGMFYKLWKKALKGENNYFTIGVPWHQVPGRDAEWKVEAIEESGSIEAFRQEHGIEFLGSSLNLIKADALEKIELEQIVDPIEVIEDVEVFSEPKEHHSYICTVDTGEGKNQDYSTFTIFDVTQQPFEQVAVYKNNQISMTPFAVILFRWCEVYNEALCVIENNNVSGALVTNKMHNDLEYPNLYYSHTMDETGIGVRTTRATKPLGCSTLKGLIEKCKLIVRSENTLQELHAFEEKGSSYEAAEGEHDDLVQNLWMFAWYTKQEGFADFVVNGSDIDHDIYEDDIDHIAMSDIIQTDYARPMGPGSDTDFF